MALAASRSASSRSFVERPRARAAAPSRPSAGPDPACSAKPGRSASLRVAASGASSYFVVKNVFKVKPESFEAFEEVWRTRESHLKEFPGFMQFAMLKCTNIPGKYVSETHWASKEDFEGWANSSQFKASHGQGQRSADGPPRPNTMTMLEGPPAPEFYETVTTTSRT